MGRRRPASVLLQAYLLLSLLDVAAERTGQAGAARLLLLVLMPLLAAFLFWSGPRPALVRWVLVGLGFAWLGDNLGDPLLLKILFFLGTQVAYALAFRPYWRSSLLARPAARIAYVVGVGALIVVVSLQASGLLVAVVVYGASLALMAALASGLGRLAAAGGLLFLVSDALLGYGRIIAPPTTQVVGALVMLTYLGAQLLIVLAVRRTATVAGGATDEPAPGHL